MFAPLWVVFKQREKRKFNVADVKVLACLCVIVCAAKREFSSFFFFFSTVCVLL